MNFDYFDRKDNMNTLEISIPYSYAYNNAILNWCDLKFGIDHKYFSYDSAIDHAFNVLEADENSPKAVWDLASLCFDKTFPFSIHPYIDDLAETCSEADKNNVYDKLLYLIIKWVYDNRDKYEDPFDTVEYIWDDFMCPSSIKFLIKYYSIDDKRRLVMPAAKRTKLAYDELRYEKWREFLSGQSRIWGHPTKQ